MLSLIKHYIYIFKLTIVGLIIPQKASRGQVLVEYALVIGVVVAALLAMQLYVRRMLQGRYRAVSDQAVHYIAISNGISENLQVDPYYEQSDMINANASSVTNTYAADGSSSKTVDYDTQQSAGMRWELPYSR